MRNYTIIVMVGVVAITTSVLIAIAVYLIDRNADRHDKKS